MKRCKAKHLVSRSCQPRKQQRANVRTTHAAMATKSSAISSRPASWDIIGISSYFISHFTKLILSQMRYSVFRCCKGNALFFNNPHFFTVFLSTSKQHTVHFLQGRQPDRAQWKQNQT